jgi:hypothetical protein
VTGKELKTENGAWRQKQGRWRWAIHEENAPNPTQPGKAGKKISTDKRRDF